MLNFVLGFFREYWPVVLACAFGRFGAPPLADWLCRVIAADKPGDGVKRHPSTE